jgi:aspartate aminotransferase, cytoplasmic
VTFVTKSRATTPTVTSILANVQRATVSSPPLYGAQIAAAVLNTPEISKQWAQDMITMSSRILSMRRRLFEELIRLETPGDWTYIVKQSGMFAYTGISTAQIEYLQGLSRGPYFE